MLHRIHPPWSGFELTKNEEEKTGPKRLSSVCFSLENIFVIFSILEVENFKLFSNTGPMQPLPMRKWLNMLMSLQNVDI